MSSDIPSWSMPASESLGILYRDLQPIEVYVEDSNSEAFYLELLNRLLGTDRVIKKVIPLHGRAHVIKNCQEYEMDSPALFIIDGDLDLHFGRRVDGLNNLFQLDAYCIENFLVCIDATRELIVEGSGTALRNETLSQAEWERFFNPILELFRELFVFFAAANKVAPQHKTVGNGLNDLITNYPKPRGPEVDPQKIRKLISDTEKLCIGEVGFEAWNEVLQEVRDKAKSLQAIDGVSGKHYLLPVLTFFIRSKCCGSMTLPSLMFKLAKYCNLRRLDGLKTALEVVMSGRVYIMH